MRGALLLAVLTLAPIGRAGAVPRGDIAEIASHLDDDDMVEKTYGALGAQHYARRHSGFNLFSVTELRDWQRDIGPLIPRIVALLGEGENLEWVDIASGNGKQITTPRKEAGLALQALERASIEPLIAVLDSAPLAPHADQVLRQITGGGPPGHDRSAWRGWWDGHRSAPLRNERGQWWLPAIFLGLLAAAVGVVVRLQRARER
jgi:hypothetical protein